MTPKEALEAIRKELQDRLDFPINLTPEYRLVNKALAELEELKKDTDRYFELDEIFENTPRGEMDKYDFEEYNQLLVKLSKVGKEK